MPMYQYFCEANGQSVEVTHSMKETVETWAELCERAGLPVGDTPKDAPVERHIYAVGVAVPMGNSRLKEMGFTKLVRRDEGVYENVTAIDSEKRYMKRGEADSVPDFSKRIKD